MADGGNGRDRPARRGDETEVERVVGGPPIPPSEPRHDPARDAAVQPTSEELRTSARLLLHIARQPRPGPDDIPLETLTQAGMARTLGMSQGSVSGALKRLVDGGAVRVERSHVRHELLRLKVYTLTPQGEQLVREIRRRFNL